MAIANYTTSIKTEKTVGEIQQMLGAAGASQVLFEYDDGNVNAISFRLMYGTDQPVYFRLPANIGRIYVVLQSDRSVPKRLKTMDQAARVAWRIIKDWIRAQLAIVEAEQAELVEVFLPYAQSPHSGKTLFQTFQEKGPTMLTGPSS